jgi:hypothetical protein
MYNHEGRCGKTYMVDICEPLHSPYANTFDMSDMMNIYYT